MKKRPSYEAQKRKEFIRSHDFSVSIGTNDRVVVIVKPKEQSRMWTINHTL